MKRSILCTIVFSFLLVFSNIAIAGEKATPEEVYDKLLQAVEVLDTLGDEGLEAFNDPKGEFVWKDTYVFAIDCDSLNVVAHPKKSRIGADISNNRDKNPEPSKRKNHSVQMCEVSREPHGGWVEYYWTKLGDEKAYRKISFAISVPNQPISVAAGIYNDNAKVDELNAKLK